MQPLELSIDRELEFLTRYELTPDELYLIKLIFYAQEGHEEYLQTFFSQCSLTKELREVLQDLQDKEIINKTYKIPEKGKEFEPTNVDFNKTMLKSLFQHTQDLGMELFEAYPPFTIINGRTFSLRNITKLYNSFDDFCWAYGKSIRFDQQKHEEILELLEWAKDNNMINSGLCDFIESRKWLDIKQMQDSDMGTFNTVELI